MKKTSFEVFASRETIDNSERNSLHYCIWALAIVNSIVGATNASVDSEESRFTYRGYRYIFPTPARVATIARKYDDGVLLKQDIKPWHDTLQNPISIERSGHRRAVAKKVQARRKALQKNKKPRRNCTARRSTRWGGRKI